MLFQNNSAEVLDLDRFRNRSETSLNFCVLLRKKAKVKQNPFHIDIGSWQSKVQNQVCDSRACQCHLIGLITHQVSLCPVKLILTTQRMLDSF